MSQPTNRTPAASQGGIVTLDWLLDGMLAGLSVCAPVRVTSIAKPGTALAGAEIWGQLLVQLRDGSGGAVDASEVYAVCARPSGIACDPVPGDIGFVVFGDRDFWAAIATGAPAPSNSLRKHSESDCVYLGTVRAASAPMIVITSAGVQINAPSVKINGMEFATHAHNVTSVGAPTGPAQPGPP